jgi:hypothetical protein
VGSQSSSYSTRSCGELSTTSGYLSYHGLATTFTSLEGQVREGNSPTEIMLQLLTAFRLIALMLGRLGMNTKEALEQYNTIAGRIFSAENQKWKFQDGAFKASTLEAEMKRVVAARSGGDKDLMMIDASLTEGLGRV